MTNSTATMLHVAPTVVKKKDAPTYYPALDGLRAFSVFFVIYHHVVNQPIFGVFEGWLGVDIFFVLSGFLITGLLFREEEKHGSINLGAFYIRRAFRILPLYWFVLAAYVVMLQPASRLSKWIHMKAALPYFLTFNNDIPLLLMPNRVGDIFGLSWTLGIEEKFYFLWPMLCFVLLSRRKSRLISGIALYVLALATAVVTFAQGPISPFSMGRGYAGLVLGAIVAVVFTSSKYEWLKSWVARVPSWLVMALMAVGFGLVHVSRMYVFVFGWIVALLVCHLLLAPSWMSEVLSWKPIVWLGKRSYAMYLIQGFGIDGIEAVLRKPRNDWEGIGIAILAYALAAALAAVLDKLIESPARNYGRKLSNLLERRHDEKRLAEGKTLSTVA